MRNAKNTGVSTDEELQSFLRVYRETPHSVTKVAPAMLLMGYSRTSGIPKFEPVVTNLREQAQLHHEARLNDKLAKPANEREYNERMRAKPSNLELGSHLLIKRERTCKEVSPWDPDPYRVIAMYGSMVTVRREYPEVQEMTSNSSFFKRKRFGLGRRSDDESGADELVSKAMPGEVSTLAMRLVNGKAAELQTTAQEEGWRSRSRPLLM